MKRIINYTFLLTTIGLFGQVGINTDSPNQTLDVEGKIEIGDDSNNPTAGTIRFNKETQDFEGYNGSEWLSLTKKSFGIQNSSENSRINSENTTSDSDFGNSVSIDGNYAVIGAPFDDKTPNSTTGSPQTGAAYIYVKNSSNEWEEQARLTATDGADNDRFGHDVDIWENTVIIGAPYNNSAYIYTRLGTTWSEQAAISAPDSGNIFFGTSVTIFGDIAMIGAPREDTTDRGAVYVYQRSGTNWSFLTKLNASDSSSDAGFGHSLDYDGNNLIVGVSNQANDGSTKRGAAYIFNNDSGTWTEILKLEASNGYNNDYFGFSVSIDGNTAAVSKFHNIESSSTAVDQTTSSAVYIYRNNGSWSEEFIIDNPKDNTLFSFGQDIDLDGANLLIGSPLDSLNGIQSGVSYLYRINSNSAELTNTLFPSNGTDARNFGYSVTIDTADILIGSPGNNSMSGTVFFYTN